MTLKTLGLIAGLALAPLGAQASTVTVGTFDVTAAVSDRNQGVQSLWFETILADGLDLVYTLSSPGTFIVDAVGATMTGSVTNRSNANAGFDFSFEYDRDFLMGDQDSQNFKAVWDDVFEHGNEDYLDFEGGTITGTGGLSGLVLQMVRAPSDGLYVTQIGGGRFDTIGANQHNSGFGLSGWMEISGVEVNLATCTLCNDDASFYAGLVGVQSDINVNLSPIAVPVPATGMLMMSVLGGIGFAARRRRKS